MALGADSLPGWRNKPARENQDATQEESQDESPDTTGAEETSTGSTTAGSTTTTGGGSENEPVVVWQAGNRLEAQIVKGRLESHGVPAFLTGEALGTIYGLTTGNLAATDVLVPAPLAQKALDILHTTVDPDELAWDDPAWDEEAWDETNRESNLDNSRDNNRPNEDKP